jgi:hypothetical protein
MLGAETNASPQIGSMALQTPSAARRRRALCIGALMTSAGLAGCSTVTKISNVDPVAGGGAYQAQYRSARLAFVKTAIEANGARCVNDASPTLIPASAMIEAPETEMLSAGDLVEIRVGQDEMLSGTFKISQDGDLRLPHLPAVRAQGLSVDNVEAAIAQRLLDLGFYRSAPPISVRVSDAAGARVYVSGAVFEPGAMVIGGVGGREVDQARQKAIGFIAESRRLSRALQTAGGVRPDADLAHVTIIAAPER